MDFEANFYMFLNEISRNFETKFLVHFYMFLRVKMAIFEENFMIARISSSITTVTKKQ
jgi:hypothetical protein